ncbi:non-classical arabinogalactan protein 30 [Brachypodium distachyon]|uniref:Uncharacterized protein n=1 Tax=Brachypodium distachyon TaxID=15368 RepID=I1HC98_BRADI|nr:non-classical arabinogalactan protein 30 [Brachypodium distachyon]KQK02819.1 hypothetical protein BRADI_2g03930v3 [Brachypodium distachyon]|eukprot:XP_010232982.1 non-classical arabinogalactan protein 30 [Brachypodium distachyon]
MAPIIRFAILLSLLALATANNDNAGYSNPQPQTPNNNKLFLRIEGLILCQPCAHRNSQCLDAATPIPNAQVTVTCRDPKNRVKTSRVAKADAQGYFLAEIGVADGKQEFYEGDPSKACFVRLLSSPDKGCNDLTNVRYGIEGAELRDEGKRWVADGVENVVYAAGPLAFRPRSCAPTKQY